MLLSLTIIKDKNNHDILLARWNHTSHKGGWEMEFLLRQAMSPLEIGKKDTQTQEVASRKSEGFWVERTEHPDAANLLTTAGPFTEGTV